MTLSLEREITFTIDGQRVVTTARPFANMPMGDPTKGVEVGPNMSLSCPLASRRASPG